MTTVKSQTEFAKRLLDKILTARGEDSLRDNYIHASDIGKCIKQSYYKLSHTPTDPDKVYDDDRINLIYKYGDALEYVLTTQMQLAHIWNGRTTVFEEELGVIGTTDPVVEFEGRKILIEIKAAHRQLFMMLKEKLADGDASNYYDQIQTYLHLYPPVEFAVLMVGNRDMRPKDIQQGLPEVLVAEIHRDAAWKKKNWNRVVMLKAALKAGIPPEREFIYDDWHCQYCAWRDTCWGGNFNNVDLTPSQTGDGKAKPT